MLFIMLLKSLKQQQEEQEEEIKQALLYHHNNSHMEDPLDSSGDRREVVVKIDSGNDCVERTENASKPITESSSGKLSGSSKKSKVSFEQVLNEAVWQRSKDLSDQEISPGSGGGEELFRNSSSRSFTRRNSWRLLMDKTKSRLIDSPDDDDAGGLFRRSGHENEEDDIEDVPEEIRNLKFNTFTILQCVSLALIIAALVCSLSIPVIKKQTLWDLPLWKWELLAFSLICGRLVSGWGIRVVVILIERRFLLRKRVLYFVYGLRKPVQNCLWLGLVLLVWHCIFDYKVEKETESKVLPCVSKILVCFLVGTLIWLLKTFLVKVLASSFHVNTFFERIQEALFNQYVIETLSGPPLFDRYNTREQEGPIPEALDKKFQNNGTNMPGDLRETLLQGSRTLQKCPTVGKKPRFSKTMSKKQHQEISIDHLHRLNQKNISAWNMKRMISIVRHGPLSTLDEHVLNSDMEDESMMEIRSECQAKEAAKKIFHKVAKPGSQKFSLDDLMCFMGKEEAMKTVQIFGASCQKEGISKSALNSWLVNAFRERRALSLSLNDTKTSVDELHNMLNILVSIIIAIIWLVILGIQITHFLVFISSQLLLAVFVFGNTCKTVFEAIIFLFIMHPFDVGDRCEVDGIQLIVEEMNILNTVFLRCSDNQKITYPNSLLSTKPIGNFYRSPDMAESIEFCVHISTPMEKIAAMKERIIRYIESNKEHWHQPPVVAVSDVEDMNKVNMIVSATHKLNFHNCGERFVRRAHLIEEMIKVFKELDLEHRMLPFDVNVRHMPASVSSNTNRLP
ncbi:hypothetical protein Ddye_007346 [Dipteronia dyeriana]|uniref:Mechanosensitive ion channel protein n=1 Tax=Dipteronia dyeriana TaxID=168575 RepID=A0AAD9XK79_9ROSI|nr:hypothetical protein Ddye_007346 [Dipteronia dyeriana]